MGCKTNSKMNKNRTQHVIETQTPHQSGNKPKVTPTAKKPHKYLGAAFGKRGLGHICVVSRHPTLVPGLSSVNSGSEYRFPKIRGLSHTPILYPGSSIEKMNATKIQGLSFLGLTLSILGCLGLSWATSNLYRAASGELCVGATCNSPEGSRLFDTHFYTQARP